MRIAQLNDSIIVNTEGQSEIMAEKCANRHALPDVQFVYSHALHCLQQFSFLDPTKTRWPPRY